MLKKAISLFLGVIVIFASVPVLALNYDIEGAYDECYTLYPVFVENVIANDTSKEEIIVFMGDARDYLLNLPEELNDENFDHHFYDAVNYAFSLRQNRFVRDALMAAYPEAVTKAIDGIISEEFMPVYNTIKRYILGISTPVVTLSCKEGKTRVHQVYMPEDTTIIVGFYQEDGTLIKAFINPQEDMDIQASYAKAFAFNNNLSPLCDSYILKF